MPVSSSGIGIATINFMPRAGEVFTGTAAICNHPIGRSRDGRIDATLQLGHILPDQNRPSGSSFGQRILKLLDLATAVGTGWVLLGEDKIDNVEKEVVVSLDLLPQLVERANVIM